MSSESLSERIFKLSASDATNFKDKRYKLNLEEPPDVSKQESLLERTTPLPESFEKEWKPFDISEPGKWLIMSDTHIPCHSVKAIETAVRYARDRGIANVLLNGDILDCHFLSRHNKDRGAARYSNELQLGRQFLQYLRERFSGRIIYKLGNHEERLEAYLASRCEEIYDLEFFDYTHLLSMDKYGVELIADKQIIQMSGLCVIHGHEFARLSDPVNPARGLWRRSKRPAMCGHLHRSGTHTEADMLDKMSICWATGCLCDLHPRWLPINNWNLGFATIELFNSIKYHVENKQFVQGELV